MPAVAPTTAAARQFVGECTRALPGLGTKERPYPTSYHSATFAVIFHQLWRSVHSPVAQPVKTEHTSTTTSTYKSWLAILLAPAATVGAREQSKTCDSLSRRNPPTLSRRFTSHTEAGLWNKIIRSMYRAKNLSFLPPGSVKKRQASIQKRKALGKTPSNAKPKTKENFTEGTYVRSGTSGEPLFLNVQLPCFLELLQVHHCLFLTGVVAFRFKIALDCLASDE